MDISRSYPSHLSLYVSCDALIWKYPLSGTQCFRESYCCNNVYLPYLLGYKTGVSSPQNDPKYVINHMKSCYKMGSPVQNNPKNLDLSYKMDLDI